MNSLDESSQLNTYTVYNICIYMFVYAIYIHVKICRFACGAGGRFVSRILFPMGLESVHEVGSDIVVAHNGSRNSDIKHHAT